MTSHDAELGHQHNGSGAAPLEAKVLTVSDGVIAGTREDRSGGALTERLTEAGFSVVDQRTIADGVEGVANALCFMAMNFAGLIVTTGGTGFGPRDDTPEGTRRVLDRTASGLTAAMASASPLNRLSRGVAGVRGRAIILNVPGSPSGAVETLEAVLDIMPHALALVAGHKDPHPV